MKKFILLGIIFASFFSAFGQENDEEDNHYVRNSIAIVTVNHGDRYDAIIQQVVSTISPSKFNMCPLSISDVTSPVSRMIDTKPNVSFGIASVSPSYKNTQINDWIKNADLGKCFLSYWFDRNEEGLMDPHRILEQGMYNASDEDVRNAAATKIGKAMLSESGYDLLKHSYVIVLDCYAAGTLNTETSSKYGVSSLAKIFKVNIRERDLNNLFENCWIYEEDNEAVRDRKRKAFDKIQIELKEVKTLNPEVYSSENDIKKCIRNLILDEILDSGKIKEWAAWAPVWNNYPIQAKLGKKEGLKNGKRFKAVIYEKDRKGKIIEKSVAKLRATKVVDNREVAAGNTAPSEFYQITSLKPVKKGMTLIESRDLRLQLSLGGGLAINQNMTVGFENMGGHLGVSYLAGMNSFLYSRMCISHYIFLDSFLSSGVKSFSGGYGCGFRPIRMLEIMPYFKAGKQLGKEGFGLSGGLDLNGRIIYPVDAFIRFEGGSIMGMYVGFGLRFSM